MSDRPPTTYGSPTMFLTGSPARAARAQTIQAAIASGFLYEVAAKQSAHPEWSCLPLINHVGWVFTRQTTAEWWLTSATASNPTSGDLLIAEWFDVFVSAATDEDMERYRELDAVA